MYQTNYFSIKMRESGSQDGQLLPGTVQGNHFVWLHLCICKLNSFILFLTLVFFHVCVDSFAHLGSNIERTILMDFHHVQ